MRAMVGIKVAYGVLKVRWSEQDYFMQPYFKPVDSFPGGRRSRAAAAGRSGNSFAEVLMSVVIVAVVFGIIIKAYIISATRAQWTGYSLAAQSLAVQTVEQTRSAVWDIALGKDELMSMNLLSATTNISAQGCYTISGYTTNIMDIPWKGTNYMLATNFVTIQTIYENNYSNYQVQLKMIRVDTVWPFTGWGNNSLRFYTNSICTYIAPDNRDPSTLGD